MSRADLEMAVLVAEDDEDVRMLLQRELGELGHPVTAVKDGLAARVLLERQHFPLLITDVRMPGLDGVALTRWVKQHRPETEVVITTAFPSLESATEALRLGATDYIVKPFDGLDQLKRSVELALRRYWTLASPLLDDGDEGGGLLDGLLEAIPLAIVVTDGEGRVLTANRRARGLAEVDARILEQTQRSGLDRLARRALDGVRPGPGAFHLRPPDDDQALLPVIRRALGRGRVAFFIGDPRRRSAATINVLCLLFDLSVAEARVAQQLMIGRSVAEIARQRRVTANTIRFHLKQIYAKTHTTSQSDLVSMLLNSPAQILVEQP